MHLKEQPNIYINIHKNKTKQTKTTDTDIQSSFSTLAMTHLEGASVSSTEDTTDRKDGT